MSAILASFLPDFSDALSAGQAPIHAAPAETPQPAPWMPARVIRTSRAPDAGAGPAEGPTEGPAAQPRAEAPLVPSPLQPMTVPEALNALQVLVAQQPAGRTREEPRDGAEDRTLPRAAALPPAPARTSATQPAAQAAAADPFANPWTGLKRSAAPEPVETPEERAARLAEAEARGREEGRAAGLAEARAEAEAALAAERADFAARLEAERARWSESEAERLAAGFAAALRALDADLTARLGRLLVPVLTDALRRRAVDELAQALARLTADPNHAAIRVSGPEDLLAALSRRLGPGADGIAFAPGAAPEVSVVADQTVIETQLAAWSRLLAAAVAES